MPFWFGTCGGFWWIFPLVGLLMMGVMVLACMRGAGCMGRWVERVQMGRASGRGTDELAELRREIQALKEDVNKVAQNSTRGG